MNCSKHTEICNILNNPITFHQVFNEESTVAISIFFHNTYLIHKLKCQYLYNDLMYINNYYSFFCLNTKLM